MKKLFVLLFAFWFLSSCEKVAEWDLEATQTDLLVVEGVLTNELKNHNIRLTHTTTDLNLKPVPASGAEVVVSDGTNMAVFTEYPSGSGVYYSDSMQAVVGKVYMLYINYEGKEYVARDEMKPVEPLKPMIYRETSEMGFYQLVFQDSNDPSYKEYWISWSHVPGYEDQPAGSTIARMQHYTLESINVNEMFKPDKKKVYFPEGSYILRKKYSLSDAHQSYLRTMLSETEWRGGIFDIQKGNVLTNLSEGAVGFFAVSTVISDTVVVVAVK